ncbi:EF-hand calcium-binding domain-containing protein 6 [Electrophorus electricus]|uniref:EF-hand calcium-binding domain-containing protein 6 n=1 Tax=Electrophorus electricus TaxID=8005 RepID=UPI0015D09161|nr:EF-hand calcium-binding domain-containing protein 6 [Electrophorus electricus]XP_035385432.1 EF-hand calcium-binding domain-containing protein 6 [Electrophorus electricus]
MSSVASIRLPAIPHPSSRLGDPETISLRGHSTDYSRVLKRLMPPRAARSPSPGTESLDSAFRSQSAASERSFETERGPRVARSYPVVHAPDPDKTKTPSFGQKVPAESHGAHRVSTSFSSTCEPQLKAQVDELECNLKERIQITGALTLKTLFKNNHPDGKPVANRSVLLLILGKFLRRLITGKQIKLLLQRLRLSDRAQVSFEDLYSALRDPEPLAPLSLSQTLALLRGDVRSSFLECVERQAEGESFSQCWISASQLRNILEKLKLRLPKPDFDRFWKRLDPDGIGALKLDVLLEKVGVDRTVKLQPLDEDMPRSLPARAQDPQPAARTISKAEEERQASITMEMWLKDRFRAGAQRMKAEFDKHDPDGCGKVSNENFLQVLANFDLRLKKEHLGLFLARCGLEFRKNGVDYIHFLRAFQDRSQDGITHRILSNPQHWFHSKENTSKVYSVAAVEAKLTQLFQSEYLSLLETFQNIDKVNVGSITQEEFRAAVESRFGLEISDREFEQLTDRLPLDRLGNVQYGVFMAAFDTRKGAPSLFEACRAAGNCGPSAKDPDNVEEKSMRGASDRRARSVSKLSRLIRSIVTKQYRDVVREFEELDEKNTKRLTQEDMYQLLKRFPVQPEITRGEVRHLWLSLLTRQDGTLDFQHFVRHFGPSPASCRYPDAKRCPPRRGDNDLMRLSNKLSYVSDILVDALRAKVELSVAELWAEFCGIDTAGTGSLSRNEFTEVLTRLCVHLSQYECEVLANKFDLNHDGRVSYREFLRPFASKDQVLKHGSNMAAALQSQGETSDSPKDEETVSLETLSTRIRKKLHRERRALRRACLRLDASHSGHLSAWDLAAVLQLCGVCGNQEDLGRVLRLLHTHPSGRLDYRPLLRKDPVTSAHDQNLHPHLGSQTGM